MLTLQLEAAARRLKTTFKVGTMAGKDDVEGIGESLDLARMLIGAFYHSRVERKSDSKVPAGNPRRFAAEGMPLEAGSVTEPLECFVGCSAAALLLM